MKSIGIIGMGFIGKAIFNAFNLYTNVKGYDIDTKKSTHVFSKVIDSDIVFLCLPSPMCENGDCDLSYINNTLKLISEKNKRKDNIFVIKSTVTTGATTKFEKKYKLNLVHNPEFLSARTANIDFITATRTIIGGNNKANCDILQRLYEDRFPGINCLILSPEESETIKYFLNCFFATKITFFNEMRLLVNGLGLDWDNIIDGILSDGRIAMMHTDVPGHDGKFGFGGACFPKDINALIKIFEDNNIDPVLLKAVLKQNISIRDER